MVKYFKKYDKIIRKTVKIPYEWRTAWAETEDGIWIEYKKIERFGNLKSLMIPKYSEKHEKYYLQYSITVGEPIIIQ